MRCLSFLLLAWALAGCSGTPTGQVIPSHASAVAATLELSTHDADVWAYALPISGTLRGAGKLAVCTVQIGARSQAVTTSPQGFTAQLALMAGENVVQARCRTDAGASIGAAPLRLTVRLPDAPRARADAELREGKLTLDARASAPSESSRAEIVRYEWLRLTGDEHTLGVGATLSVPVPREPGTHSYAVRVRDAAGQVDVARSAVEVGLDGSARVVGEESPAWIDRAIVYGVIPTLYGEPPLRNVMAKLASLEELGVNTLWLSPLFDTPADDFGYGVKDYFTIRDGFGGDAELRALVQAAHGRGMRVLLDLPLNHTSIEHRYFQQAERMGARSHYFGFYDRDANGVPTHYFDWKHLPNLAYDNAEVQRWVLAFSSYWLQQFDVDGYRVDAAWGVRQRHAEFYPIWRSELKRVKPDVLLLAEASARDPYYLQHGYDAAYDWTEELGHHAWENVFSAEPGIAARLRDAIDTTRNKAPRPERTLRFLNNNDTGERFITRHGEPLTRVATAALLTLPGIPCVYAFDEVGFGYLPYDEQVPTQPEHPELRALHRSLIALRKGTPALHGAGYRVLAQEGELLVYLRTGAAPGESALVALNFGVAPVSRTLALSGVPPSRLWVDALSKRKERMRGDQLALAVPGHGFKILVPPSTLASAPAPR